MKTKKLMTVLSLALIFAMGASAYAGNGTPVTKSVTYVVNIDKNVKVAEATYIITVYNDKNQPVAHPQVFKDNIWQYTFTETGSIPGTLRYVTMVKDDNGDGGETLVFDPAKLLGPFKSGATYNFPLLSPRHTIGTDPTGVQ
ncbi:MAG: hypothetical protein NTX61_09350 [Bacteroidetes bacterium]|nr:hypothetical protein [Bacteroidota bacterium]